MVTNRKKPSEKTPVKQGAEDIASEPNKINGSTRYDFNGKNLTPYDGLLPVITMLEKLGFQSLVEQTVTSKRIPCSLDLYRFVLGIMLGLYIGFPRLNQLRFIARDPILTGILKVTKLPVQSTFWRRIMRERVWEAAKVKLEVVTIDTDTTVHTLYGQQMGGRKSYNPKNKGKKSYQPMLTLIAETREYVRGELRNSDRPTGKQIGDHLRSVRAALPPGVEQIYGRSDSGFYCQEAVEGYEEIDARFVICARKTARLEQLRQAEWKPSPWFYGQRGGAENLIKEANNDAGLAAHPSGRFDVNSNHFQLTMPAYNLNCWLCCSTANRRPTPPNCTTRPWRHRGCASYSWQQRLRGPHWRQLQRSL